MAALPGLHALWGYRDVITILIIIMLLLVIIRIVFTVLNRQNRDSTGDYDSNNDDDNH